jgi:thiosulfate dehydrogenase
MKRFLLGVVALLLSLSALFIYTRLSSPPALKQDAASVRGAALVAGPGHCGTCHTPRGDGLVMKVGDDALSGAVAGSWFADSLRGGSAGGFGSWSEADIVEYLKTGRTDHAAAFGDMSDVVERSTQHMSQNDLAAMAHYLKQLQPPAKESADQRDASSATFEQLRTGNVSKPGATLYVEFCVSCHRADGAGVGRIYPSLAGSSAVLSKNPLSLVHVVLTGSRMPKVDGGGLTMAMPGFSFLSDQDVASVVSFIRTSWGNNASEVSSSAIVNDRPSLGVGYPARPVGVPAGFAAPLDTALAADTQGALIMEGKRLMTETKRLLPDNVGNQMNCTSCHLSEAKLALGSPFIGSNADYPGYNPRAGREVTMAERINGCFVRSMNGKAVPTSSEEMKAMLAYMDWLTMGHKKGTKFPGKSVGTVNNALVPNPDNGRKVYAQSCAECHGKEGEGLKDARGEYVFPPLWGNDSFNIGAGMARTYTAAAFVKNNMPVAHGLNNLLGEGHALNDQDAVDVADYFTHKPRPDFAPKVDDWPKGDKPKDSRY